MKANCKRFWRVYILPEPDTHAVRYVGITSTSLDARLAFHLTDRSNPEKWAWISELDAQGLTPGIREIDHLYSTRREAEAREREYIWSYLAQGADLFNRSGIVGDPECFRAFLRRNYHEVQTEVSETLIQAGPAAPRARRGRNA